MEPAERREWPDRLGGDGELGHVALNRLEERLRGGQLAAQQPDGMVGSLLGGPRTVEQPERIDREVQEVPER